MIFNVIAFTSYCCEWVEDPVKILSYNIVMLIGLFKVFFDGWRRKSEKYDLGLIIEKRNLFCEPKLL
ncbi:hypothetical protein RO04_05640 [Aggregatibacter actinomycetemcomitans]|uniref:Uncharacterized protein n=1 Tax=Aggregatibacter actinomycetemcomitans TaxID=714 RepID=A0A2G1DMH7_AGGAC|nr:hypothetical protein RO04_05640 [Aggregatibacter actinomycetemcomitans]PHO19703.1 hypothetical protein CQR80_10765 [Aggregatibacter actinomycetemcomitans]PHO21910.1 hypothetical protein CQR79_10990 [Aggregatibacter actinomycetemcomitans]TQE41534.1 hypothetical protein SC1000_04595 [Aggregatibacter actinomycetemcomitans]